VDEQPEHDGVAPEEIQLPRIDTPRSTLYELAAFIARAMDEEERVAALAKDYLDKFYEEIGNDEEAASAVLSYIQSRHKWDVELLAEKAEVEHILYDEYSMFDDLMWEKVLDTEAVSELHHQVHNISLAYIREAIEEVLDKEASNDEEDPF
jgi:hypothetical protein